MANYSNLLQRANHCCELCGSDSALGEYTLPFSDQQTEASLILCATCLPAIDAPSSIDANHWRCLNDAVWSPTPAVQVAAWRLLKQLEQPWARDLLETVYLDEETQAWAEAPFADAEQDEAGVVCKDANGVQLAAGDTVVVMKDLPVKGTSMVAKRGTSVRGISLTRNPEHIEGRVNGQRVVLLSCYVKK